MEEFDPKLVNEYSIEQLIYFLNNGYTKEDFFNSGLSYIKRPQLEWEELKNKYSKGKCKDNDIQSFIDDPHNSKYVGEAQKMLDEAKKDNADWSVALKKNSILAFKYYLKIHPKGAHADEANQNISEIEFERYEKLGPLLDDMKAEPWKYKADIMHMLFDGGYDDTSKLIIRDIENSEDFSRELPGLEKAAEFLKNHLNITMEDLWNQEIVPQDVTKTDICAPDFQLPATTVKDMGTFPTDRTDVYFLGVPRSGKSSVLSGIIYHLWKTGCAGYEPHMINGIDPCSEYYEGLINALGKKKPPTATPTDTISFMKLNIRNGRRTNKITIVELSGEAFSSIAAAMKGEVLKEVWAKLGATQCLQSSNRKCLFFVLDYSIISGKGGDERYSPASQSLVLESALRVLSNDGPDPNNPTRGCTMSKVKSVAVIMTKSDLMENATTPEERVQIAQDYIYTHFLSFMNQLHEVCQTYGINKAEDDYRPYILTFSLGKFYVGNTVIFDETDATRIIRFISDITPSINQRRTHFWGI